MILYNEIESLFFRLNVPRETIEKDYCITWILAALSFLTEKEGIVFYGGTAIKKAYFPDFRYSEDIDFISLKNLRSGEVFNIIDRLYAVIKNKANINFFTEKESIRSNENRLQFFAAYDGFQETGVNKKIKIDVSSGIELFQPPALRKIHCNYSDMKNLTVKLLVYTREAIITDKISTILSTTRNEPRDLYDLWFLLKNGNLDYGVVKANFKNKFGYPLNFSFVIPGLHNIMYKDRWASRLSHQMHELPDFNRVLKETEEMIRKRF